MCLASLSWLLWKIAAKDFSPFLFCRPFSFWVCRFMFDCLYCNIVTPLCFILKIPFFIHILTTAWRSPILLFSILVGHPLEEVSTHVIIVPVRFITILVVFN